MKRYISFFLAVLTLAVFALRAAADGFDEEYSAEQSDSYGLSDESVSAEAELNVKAKAAVLMEVNTGTLLYESNGHERLSPASITKIMTLLLVMEAIDSGKISMEDTVATSSEAAEKGGSQIWLEVGEEMTVRDLIKATAVGSANDASVALAEHVAGSEEAFVSLMNERAKELGMTNTSFENCTGLDDTAENHYSSAYDVALMSCELLKHESILEFTTIWMDSLRDGKTELVNTNKLVRFYEGITGLKTGTTEKAGKCLSASARRDDLHLVAVVMGSETSDDRFNGARSLLNWGFANYEIYTPEPDLSMIAPVRVTHGEYDSVVPVPGDVTPILIRRGAREELKIDYSLNGPVEAPVAEGQTLGRVTVSLGGEELGHVLLVSPEDIGRLTFAKAFVRILEGLVL